MPPIKSDAIALSLAFLRSMGEQFVRIAHDTKKTAPVCTEASHSDGRR